MLHLKTAKLARWQIYLVCWSAGLLLLTGGFWLILHHFLQIQGEFGPEANPLEPWMLRAHGAAMQAFLLGAGSLLVIHVWRGWSYRNHRVLGVSLLTVAALLTLSGYLLYYLGDEGFRSTTSAIHWIIGLIALPVFLTHYRQGKRTRNS